MDRTTQIIAILAMVLISSSAFAQHGKKLKNKGIQAYPVYHLQGLEFEQDSSIIGLYGWLKSKDRMAVMDGDTSIVALVMDTLISLPALEMKTVDEIDHGLIDERNLKADSASIFQQMSIDSVYYWDDFVDFDPDELEITSGETIVESQEQISDSLFSDSLDYVINIEDSLIMEPVISDSLSTEGVLVEEKDSIIQVDKSEGRLLIKSDPSILGDNQISRPQLETIGSRRTILQQPPPQPAINNNPIVQTPARKDTLIIIEKVVEKPASYTGEYSGLSKSERERQLRLDADSKRKAEAAQVLLDKKRLDAEIKAQNVDPTTENGVISPSSTTVVTPPPGAEQPSTTPPASTGSESVQLNAPLVVEKKVDPVIIVQRDTLTEKAVELLAARLVAESRRDSLERLAESKRIDSRFDHIEHKMDTLLDALGKRVVMDKAVYSIPKEELNVYFAINSHTITGRQMIELENYLSQLSGLSGYRIVLSGYADSSGNLDYNRMLVDKRINAVKEAILAKGVAPTELLVNNYGKQKANPQKTYNQLDRKVSIQIFSVE